LNKLFFYKGSIVAIVIGYIASVISLYNFHELAANSYWPLESVSIAEILFNVTPCLLLVISTLLTKTFFSQITTTIAIFSYVSLSCSQLLIDNPQHGSEDILGTILLEIIIGILAFIISLLALIYSDIMEK